MAPKYVPASATLKSFNCPICGAHADQQWFQVGAKGLLYDREIPLFLRLEKIEEFETNRTFARDITEQARRNLFINWRKIATGKIFLETLDEWSSYKLQIENLHVSQCYSCKDISLWKHDVLLHPRERYHVEVNSDLNEDIKKDFEEACTVLDISPRAAAALLRLCIQKICIQLGEAGKSIDKDIKSLVSKGLKPEIQRALDIVRVVGNEAVHPGTIDLNDDRGTAGTLFSLVNRIAYDMISHPKEIAALYNELPAEKIKAIETRDAK